ncbi:hypothetical protein [Bacillus cereus group sp. MYBK95-2]|uniref:hypothetical protein n=1 Tax=Bacillus cereus group sp. MYBK95-2 TaxID=3450599 RepID=UPI003F7A3CE6
MSKILLRREDNARIYNIVDKISAKLGIKDIVVVYKNNSKLFFKQYTGLATSKG